MLPGPISQPECPRPKSTATRSPGMGSSWNTVPLTPCANSYPGLSFLDNQELLETPSHAKDLNPFSGLTSCKPCGNAVLLQVFQAIRGQGRLLTTMCNESLDDMDQVLVK